jgi:hypothetical protein
MSTYLSAVHAEAERRGYAFDRRKIGRARTGDSMPVNRGQIAYEWEHLMAKLAIRSPESYRKWRSVPTPACHPFMRRRAGAIESWERPS